MEQLICHAFIEERAKSEKDALLSFLPEKEKKKFSLPPPSTAVCNGFNLEKDILSSVHFSWFSPFLRGLPEEEALLFLSTFQKQEGEELQKELLISSSIPSSSALTKKFLQKELVSFILKKKKKLLPLIALPPSSLDPLLALQGSDLLSITDLLGLHDLAVEMTQIIDSAQLKKIHQLLPQKQSFFLKTLSHNREPVVFKKMGIVNWKGDPKGLFSLLRKRGMNRLAKALYVEHSDFVWYVMHKMPSEDAHLFEQLYKPLETEKLHHLLGRQVLEALSFFSTYSIESVS